MEENEKTIENNIINSIGSNEEITEPHVKQIISSFYGRKFSREDINKFKQLESSFRKIATLEDGESLLKNLTSDIRDTVISGAYYQINNGTVSIGQVATIVLTMAENTYQENRSIEIERARESVKSVQEKAIEKANYYIDMSNAGFTNKEEFDKYKENMTKFLKGIGLNLSKEQEQFFNEGMDNLYRLGTERDENGKIKNQEEANLLSRFNMASKSKKREDMLLVANEMIAYYTKKIQGMDAMIDRSTEVMGARGRDVNRKTYYVKQKELYENMLEIAKSYKATIERHEECDIAQVFGENADAIQMFIENNQKMVKLEREGKQDSEEYKRLKTLGNNILKTQEIQELDKQIEIHGSKLKKYKEEYKTAADDRKRVLKGYIEVQNQRLCLYLSKKEKLLGYITEGIKEYEMEDFKYSSLNIPVMKRQGGEENDTRTDIANNYARKINDMYMSKDGNVSIFEQQMAFMGKKNKMFEKRDTSQIAVEGLIARYERFYIKAAKSMKNAQTEERKQKIFTDITRSKQTFARELGELNISNEYKAAILSQYTVIDGVIDPEEYQMMQWKVSIEFSKAKGRDTHHIEEMLKRLENNKGVFSEVMLYIMSDEKKGRMHGELLEALPKVLSGSKKYMDLKEATTEEEIMNLLMSDFDTKFADKPKINDEVKAQIMDIFKKIYDERGKDGILTFFENKTASRDYFRRLERQYRKATIMENHYIDLKEDERVIFGRTDGEEKSDESKWPDFITRDGKVYLEIMYSLRKARYTEEQITNTLIQMAPEGARDAYALYELITNKKLLSDPEMGDDEKEAIRGRNKEIIDMMYNSRMKKLEEEEKHLKRVIDREKDPEQLQYYKGELENCKAKQNKVTTQKNVFDIEKAELKVPDEEPVNEDYKARKKASRTFVEKIKGNKYKVRLSNGTIRGEPWEKEDKASVEKIKTLISEKERKKKTLRSAAGMRNTKVETESTTERTDAKPITLEGIIKKTDQVRVGEINAETKNTKEIGSAAVEQGREDSNVQETGDDKSI